MYEDKKRLQNEIDEFEMLASSKSDEIESMKQKSKAYNEGKMKESNPFKSNKKILSHRIKTSCTERNLTTAMSSKKLKKRRKFKFLCFLDYQTFQETQMCIMYVS